MNRNALTTAVVVVAAFAVGLSWSWFTGRQGGRVAVVDLDEVARRLHRDNEISDRVQAKADKLEQELKTQTRQAQNHLEEIQKGLGSNPSQDATKQFAKLAQTENLKLNQIKQKAEFELSQHRQELISRFRKDAKPAVERVARNKGYSTIVTRNDAVVLTFDSGVDITDDVVQLMSAEMPAPSAPATRTKPEAPGSVPPAAAQNPSTPAGTQTASRPVPITP